MKRRDTFDVMCGLLGLAGDALAFFSGFKLATWIYFDSGLIKALVLRYPGLAGVMNVKSVADPALYNNAAILFTIILCFVFQLLGLYRRPQFGNFTDRIPRIIRATGLGILLSIALAFATRNPADDPLSRVTVAIAAITITMLALIARFILFRAELVMARGKRISNRVAVIGTDHVAARLRQALEKEPRLRTRVVAFLTTSSSECDPAIPADLIAGHVDDLPRLLEKGEINQVVLSDPGNLTHQRMTSIIIECEKYLVSFNFVPDLFRLLTINMDIQNVDGIPILGTAKWPLDYFWNRVLKRAEDVTCSLAGLILSSPLILVSAIVIKLTSRGPVFYKQERCGEKGRSFNIYKLRTMRVDAEKETGPVWAAENDPRRTRVGAFLREWNIDELPQFWNVLKGDMSMVGPRPERPHFVEQFKEDIGRYMWRHYHRPGVTGWAQVNGLRGNTSIQDRINYDLYYLENWSLAFDFKILVLTLFARKNAY